MAARADPPPAFRFEILIDGLAAAGFSECSGLDSETEVVEYREGGVNDRVHKFLGGTRQPNLVLRRGVTGRELYDWHAALVAGNVTPRNCAIHVYDVSGRQVIMEWRIRAALPVKWLGPKLDALASRVAVEMLELAHEGLVRTI
jgi:phage tail-like protein